MYMPNPQNPYFLENTVLTNRSAAGTGLQYTRITLTDCILIMAELVNNGSTLLNSEHGEMYLEREDDQETKIGLMNGWTHAGSPLNWNGRIPLAGSWKLVGMCDHDISLSHVLHCMTIPLRSKGP